MNLERSERIEIKVALEQDPTGVSFESKKSDA